MFTPTTIKAVILFIASTYAAALPYQPQSTEELINIYVRGKISRIALAIDQQNSSTFSDDFIPYAVANLGAPNDAVEGLRAIQILLRGQVAHHVTQHTFIPTTVGFTDKASPNSLAYVLVST